MPFVPHPTAVRVHQRAELHGQQIENVHFFAPVDATPIDLATLADEAHAAWTTEVMPPLSADYTLRETFVVSLASETAPGVTKITVPNVTGGAGNPAAPGGTTLCLSLRTGQRGRSARGRQYISGLTASGITDNSWNDSYANDIVQSFAAYAAAVEANAGAKLVVASSVSDGAPRPELLITDVQAITLTDFYVDSQRRRLTGRGK